MWLMTKHGFYSITQNHEGQYQVRARERQDLENLRDGVPLSDHTIVDTPNADYPYRLMVDEVDLTAIMAYLTATLDYPNFKAEIHNTPSQAHKVAPYATIWWVLMDALEKFRS